VSAERERFKQEIDVGLRHMEFRDLKFVPGFLEQDLFTSIQVMPGVTSVSDLNNALYIRGGNSDENLILLDGMTVYNPYHAGGLFSTFNVDAIKSADLLVGGFPAEYGERLSSVLDIETKAGNSKKFCGKGDLSLLSAKILLEGPIPNGSWLVSARRTYIDKIIDLLSSEKWPAYFYDLHSKVNFDLSSNLRITLSGFFGKDLIYPEPLDVTNFRWSNHALGLKLRYIFSPKVFSTLLVTKSTYYSKTYVTAGDQLRSNASDFSVKGDLSYFLSDKHTLKSGFNLSKFDLMGKCILGFKSLIDYDRKADYFAFYVQDKFKPNQSMIANIGVRGDYWAPGKYLRMSPRLLIKYFLRPDLALKSAFGYYYQFMTVPTYKEEVTAKFPLRMFQMWYPVNEEVKPLRSIHYVLGAQKWLSPNTSLDVEGYYKHINNVLELKEVRENGEDIFNVGRGYALGLELLLKRSNSWISYAYAVTRRTIAGVSFYPIHDCRHKFNIAWNFALRRSWDFGIRWIYASGLPYTGVVGMYTHLGLRLDFTPPSHYPFPDFKYSTEEIYGWRCGLRYPPYHRMDVIFSRKFKLRKYDSFIFGRLQILNVYNRKNALEYQYQSSGKKKATGMLPILPSIGIRIEF